jgi:putative tryptophan/tyrosine transport system substrate-binding protein
MNRRALIGSIACGFLATSLEVGAQRTEKVARIGVLCQVRCEGLAFDGLRDGLRSAGWVEGGNLRIEYRAAGGQIDRLPALAQELVDLKPDLIVSSAPQPSRAAKDATSTIPIVFVAVADPVRVGLVESLARPGGNVTGIAAVVPGGFIGKSLEQLKQALPKAIRIAVLLNPTSETNRTLFPLEAPAVARQLGVDFLVLEARTAEEIEPAIDAAVKGRADALYVPGDALFHNPPQRVPELAARAKLPSIYFVRELVTTGGLMSYGPDFVELFRRAAVYADKILKGTKPADLPVEQPTKYQLVINLKTAKALGVTIPQSLLLRADEVIQ